MHDVACAERRVFQMAVQEVPAAPGGDRAGRTGIGAQLDEGVHRDARGLALRGALPADRGGAAQRFVRDRGASAQQRDLGRGLDQPQLPDQVAKIDEARVGQRRLHACETCQWHAVGVVIQPDPRAIQPAARQRVAQHRHRVFPIAERRHVGDPTSLPARRRVQRADQEERFALQRNAHAAPAVFRIAVAGEPGHRLDLIEQRDRHLGRAHALTEPFQAGGEFRGGEDGMRCHGSVLFRCPVYPGDTMAQLGGLWHMVCKIRIRYTGGEPLCCDWL